MKATIQQVKEIRRIPETDTIEIVEVCGRSVVVKVDQFEQGDLCVYIETPNTSPNRFFPTKAKVVPISVLNGEDEMKVGISKQPWGDQLQLGPYDNALVIEVGTDVTSTIQDKQLV